MPVRLVKRHSNDKPWVTDTFRYLIRRRQYAFRTGNMTAFRRFRNAAQRLAKQLRRVYYERCVAELRVSSPRNWWQHVKQFIGLSAPDDLRDLCGNLFHGNTGKMANGINTFFASVAADLPPLHLEVLASLADDYTDDFIIEVAEVERRLSNISVNKSSGPDGLPNWLLKDMAPFLAGPICAIFNASVRQARVPLVWKQANVVPVPKVKPAISIEDDLRPISLTPTLSKILESFIGNWIMKQIVMSLNSNQFGALRGRSTNHALVSVLHQWCNALDSGQSVRALFVDFRKAFDRVDHTLMLNKLLRYGVSHSLVKWMFSFLQGRRQRVKIGGLFSDWLELKAGFPQGTWLGPLAFVLLIDDLNPSCNVHKFVDDTTFTEIISRTDNTSHMDEYGQQLVEWSANNFMLVNYKKTKEMVLGGLQEQSFPPLLIDGHIVERVASFKLLGVHIDDDLRWSTHIKSICSKANSRIYFLKLLKRAGLPPDALLCYYTTVIRPLLEYACVVWHHGLTQAQSDQLERLQKRVIRIIYELPIIGTPYEFA
jgi:hypothetical protein